MKAQLLLILIRFVMGAIALGIGIWYLSESLGGASLTYSSMDAFLSSIGVQGDIADANGCFLCGYIGGLFDVIGRAAQLFWTAILDHMWMLMAIGFGIFFFVDTITYIYDKSQKALAGGDGKIEFKPWFDKMWRQALRVIIVGAGLGMLGMGGVDALRTIADIIITPVLYIGALFSMAATGVTNAASCGAMAAPADGILNPVFGPFMCVIGNINSIMLAGAAGGFALMNYAWLGMGGGAFTWVAGLALVIMFLIIGFNLFFKILSVIFKLVFLIVFLPLLGAAAAFEPVWAAASGLVKKAINMLVGAAIQIIAITLEVVILYATISYAADEYFPGPYDGYSAILPPMMGQEVKNPDARTLSVMKVFSDCERVSLRDGVVDGDIFKQCFDARRAATERQYPGAFDFMDNGWEFLLMMMGLFLLYYYAVAPKVNSMISSGGKNDFDFGTWTLDLGKKIWSIPTELFGAVSKAIGKKD